jgi:hypothetical protein
VAPTVVTSAVRLVGIVERAAPPDPLLARRTSPPRWTRYT